MPKLMTQRSGKRRKPACGRIVATAVPHSPFQKIIDAARLARGHTFRSLATAMKKAGGEVSHNTLWGWINGPAGYPDEHRGFGSAHLRAFSRVLLIDQAELTGALDASRHLFTPKENPVPQDSIDAFGSFIETIRNDRRKTLLRTYVLNLAERLHAGSGSPIEKPAPKARPPRRSAK